MFIFLPIFFAGLIYGWFWIVSQGALKKSNIFDVLSCNMQAKNVFTVWLSGIDKAGENIGLMFKSFLSHFILVFWFIAGGYILAAINKIKTTGPKIILLFMIAALWISGAYVFLSSCFSFKLQYRCLGLIYLLAGIISFFNIIKSKGERKESILLITLSIFSFLLILRIFLAARPAHYGFYLLVPGIIIYHILYFKIIPWIIKEHIARKFFCFGFVFVFTFFALNYFLISRSCYLNRTLKVSSSRGGIYVFDNEREYRCIQLMDFLAKNTDKRDTVAVLPEGLTINFFLDRDNPLYYYTYLPQDLARETVINKIIDDMKNKKVDYYVLLQRQLEEYGFYAFGRDYGNKIRQYILEDYVLYKQFGPFPYTSQNFGIAVFKKKTYKNLQ